MTKPLLEILGLSSVLEPSAREQLILRRSMAKSEESYISEIWAERGESRRKSSRGLWPFVALQHQNNIIPFQLGALL